MCCFYVQYLWVGSFPINLVIGQEKNKSELEALFTADSEQAKERKCTSSNEFAGG